MTTHIISALIVAIFFANTVIASAQVSSGYPAAAEQNAAKHPTDDAPQNSDPESPRDALHPAGHS
jgi:hypothetical protein